MFNVLGQTGHDQNQDLGTKKVKNMIIKIILSFGALVEGSTPAATCLNDIWINKCPVASQCSFQESTSKHGVCRIFSVLEKLALGYDTSPAFNYRSPSIFLQKPKHSSHESFGSLILSTSSMNYLKYSAIKSPELDKSKQIFLSHAIQEAFVLVCLLLEVTRVPIITNYVLNM